MLVVGFIVSPQLHPKQHQDPPILLLSVECLTSEVQLLSTEVKKLKSNGRIETPNFLDLLRTWANPAHASGPKNKLRVMTQGELDLWRTNTFWPEIKVTADVPLKSWAYRGVHRVARVQNTLAAARVGHAPNISRDLGAHFYARCS